MVQIRRGREMTREKYPTLLKIVSSLFLIVSLLVGGCADEPTKTSNKSTDQNIIAEFDISTGGDPILLPVKYKGEKYSFIFDTGSSHTVFDISFRQELGDVKKTEKGLTQGNPIVAEIFDAPEAFLGPLNLQDSGQVSCLDLKMLSLIDGRKISGIIGMNFLRRYVIQIDFDKGTLSFLQPVEEQHPDWGIELPIWYDSLGLPVIKSNILNNINVDFVIDTAANSTGGLGSDIFKQILSKNKLKTSETLFATASGVIKKREIRIDSLSVGAYKYVGLIFSEANYSQLGLLFLARHTVTIDLPNRRVYFKRGKQFKKEDETDMSGLHLLRISNQIVVFSVDEDSPAKKAGINPKDIILKVGERDASKYDMWELRRLLMSEDKRKIEMTIKRGEDIKDISFLLKKKI
jgi:hypothetical protein